jgi:hypothetical protein
MWTINYNLGIMCLCYCYDDKWGYGGKGIRYDGYRKFNRKFHTKITVVAGKWKFFFFSFPFSIVYDFLCACRNSDIRREN